MRPIVRFTLVALFAAPAALVGQQTTAPTQLPANIVTRIIRASLRGIALSETEKASLATVHTSYQPRFQTIASELKPIRLALRDARQKHDTAAARTARRALREPRKAAVVLLRGSLVDIRGKLTPEHQTLFDANLTRVRALIRRWAQGTPF